MRQTRDFDTPVDAEQFRALLVKNGHDEVQMFERGPALIALLGERPYGVSWLDWTD